MPKVNHIPKTGSRADFFSTLLTRHSSIDLSFDFKDAQICALIKIISLRVASAVAKASKVGRIKRRTRNRRLIVSATMSNNCLIGRKETMLTAWMSV